MKNALPLIAAILGAVSLHAQRTYTVVPETCPTNTTPMQCDISMTPPNALGIYPVMELTDNLVTNTGGYIVWDSVQGPTGQYLGGAVIDSSSATWATVCSNGACIHQVTSLTLTFTGVYCPCSTGGSGTYTGTARLNMAYRYQIVRRGIRRWMRGVTGTVTIR